MKGSSLALDYACMARHENSPNGIIIVVNISDLSEDCMIKGSFGIYLLSKFQPIIVGYCIIPQNYQLK